MTKNIFKCRTGIPVLLCSALVAGTSPAQDAALPEPEPAEVRQYAVEIIIFAYNENIATGSEVFVPELLDESDAVPTFGDSDDTAAEELDIATERFEVQSMTPDMFRMQESYGRLSRLQAYKPLMHFGWLQKTIPDAEPPQLPLARFGQPPDGLVGEVALKLSRYLHLDIDVTLAADAEPATAMPGFVDDETAFGDDGLRQRVYAPLRYRIDEARIMKNGETRYYDHPKFGVLAQVWRVETNETR